MSKRGRPAKPRTAMEPMDRPAALWQRARDIGDPKLGSEIGRLHFAHRMTATELQAAAHVANIYGRYERMAGIKRSCRSPSYEVGYGGGTSNAVEGERDVHASVAWHELQDQIPQIPIGLRAWLELLVVEDRHIDAESLVQVRRLLGDLAQFFGVVSGKNQPRKLRTRQKQTKAPQTLDVQPKWAQIEREVLRKVLIMASPNLQSYEIDSYANLFFTLKERERFQQEKAARKRQA